MELATRRNFRKTTIARAGRSPGQTRSGQCERLNLDSLHCFMFRWLDHVQVDGIGRIIDHFYADFGANRGSGEFTLLGRSALLQYRYAFTNNPPGVYPFASLLYLH